MSEAMSLEERTPYFLGDLLEPRACRAPLRLIMPYYVHFLA